MNKKIVIAVIAGATLLVFAVLGVSGYFYWSNSKKIKEKNVFPNANEQPTPVADQITETAIQGVLPSIDTNPLENKPDINPADKANPFKNIETNPFK